LAIVSENSMIQMRPQANPNLV